MTRGPTPSNAGGRTSPAIAVLRREIEHCRRCPRLVRWREEVAVEGARRRGEEYWGRPLSGFGDRSARLILVGLAPAAQGGNRTGRVFTGDRSAEFLMAALHRANFANQPTSTHREDGLVLRDAFMTAAVRCAPPENRPTPAEALRCRPYLERELRLLPDARVLLALGGFAFDQLRRAAPGAYGVASPRGPFAHGRRLRLGPGLPEIWGCYHPSPRNVQTGKFSAAMFDRLLADVRGALAASANH